MPPTVAAVWKSIEAAAPHLEIGRQVGSYSGALVLEARQLDTDRRILLRVGSHQLCALGQDGPRVNRSVAKLRSLKHPAVATIFGGGLVNGFVFLETEDFRGRFLGELPAERPLSSRQRQEIALQIGEALAYLHSQSVQYGPLLPYGLVLRRQHGSLRMAAKLVRAEAMRGFKPNGSEQRAFAEFLLALTTANAASQGTDIDVRLRELAAACAEADSDAPRLAEVVDELRHLAGGNKSAAASIYIADSPLNNLPVAAVSSQLEPRRSYPKIAAMCVMIGVVVVGGMIRSWNADRSRNRSTSWTGRSGAEQSLAPLLAPRDNRARNGGETSRQGDAFGGLDGTPSYGSARYAQSLREHTHFFTRGRRQLTNPSGNAFGPPRNDRHHDTVPSEDFILSNPTWAETPRGEILVSVECAADPFRPTTLRLVWILEGSDGGQLEARIFGGIPESGMLHGTIRRNFGRPLRPPVSTYLAEARAGLDEPRRVSNILTVAETSP